MSTPSLYIVNPVAGKGKSLRIWRDVEARLRRRRLPFESRITPGPDTVAGIAEEAVSEGYDTVIAVGGDGTVREVAGALAGSSVRFGIIPSGTGNDFARTLNLPGDLDDIIDVVTGNETTPADLGQMNGRYFVNIAGVGVDTEIVEEVNRRPVVINGTITYLISAVRTVLRYEPPAMTIRVDGTEVRGRVLVLAIANGKYYGGGIKMAPDARVNDGLFHVLVAKEIGRWEALRVLPLTYSGRHVRHKKCFTYTGAEVTVEADRPLAVQADGTVVGRLPMTFRVVPHALNVLTRSSHRR
ncbi:MAG: diacylglycerol/lipid kinase family protein [Ignavibacteriales bacterium]